MEQPPKQVRYEKWEYSRKRGVFGDERNRFLLSLEFFCFGSIVFLASLGESRATVYLTVLAMVYLAPPLVFRIKRRTRLDFLGAALFVVFIWGIGLSLI